MSESEAKSASDWAAQVMLATQQQMQVMAAAQTAAFVDAQMVPPSPALPAPCP